MAISPEQQNDAFLREVDENYRRDRMESFAKSYGKWIALAVVLFLAAVGGWLYWQNRQNAQTADQSEEFHRIFGDIAQGNLGTVPARLDTLKQSGNDAVAALATLTSADVALEQGNRTKAAEEFRALASNEDVAQPYRDIATIRLTATQFDTIKPEEVISRLEPLAKPGNPWFASAAEMTALAYVKVGQNQKAGQIFAQIAADRQAPESLRTRAVQIASSLGVDASGSLEALQQQDSTE